MVAYFFAPQVIFLSTLSLRRATYAQARTCILCEISIHALLAESDALFPGGTTPLVYFYPRSPCGERQLKRAAHPRQKHFYPRSPCGERLAANKEAVSQLNISIHALLAESDLTTLAINSYADYISIHALLAESDPGKVKVVEPGLVFLSTLSLRRATA